MRSLDEILHSLREKHGYSDQEITELSRNLDRFAELSYMAFREQKRLSENNRYDKQSICNSTD